MSFIFTATCNVEKGIRDIEKKEDGRPISRLVNGEEILAIEQEPSTHYKHKYTSLSFLPT